jgi:hypothetical protein
MRIAAWIRTAAVLPALLSTALVLGCGAAPTAPTGEPPVQRPDVNSDGQSEWGPAPKSAPPKR